MKKVVSLLLALIMAFSLVACGEKKGETDDNTVPYKIGIVTGSVSQSEDDRRGAEGTPEGVWRGYGPAGHLSRQLHRGD